MHRRLLPGPDAKVNKTADRGRSTPAHPLGRFKAQQTIRMSEGGRLKRDAAITE